MEQMTRVEVVRELAKLAELVTADAVSGCMIVAVARNGSSNEILVPPSTKEGVEKLMLAVDRTHFRMQTMLYLGPKGGPASAMPSGGEPTGRKDN